MTTKLPSVIDAVLASEFLSWFNSNSESLKDRPLSEHELAVIKAAYLFWKDHEKRCSLEDFYKKLNHLLDRDFCESFYRHLWEIDAK